MFVVTMIQTTDTGKNTVHASYVGEDRDTLIRQGLNAKDQMLRSYPGYTYRVLVGTLTDEAATPEKWELKPINNQIVDGKATVKK